jgi:hypothetical protein
MGALDTHRDIQVFARTHDQSYAHARPREFNKAKTRAAGLVGQDYQQDGREAIPHD